MIKHTEKIKTHLHPDVVSGKWTMVSWRGIPAKELDREDLTLLLAQEHMDKLEREVKWHRRMENFKEKER